MTKKQAAIYARVSTDEQAARGYSISTQLAACRDYAQRQGWAVSLELADDCSGTIPVRERPEGKRLYTAGLAGEVGAVVLYTIDRAARDEEVIEYLLFKRDMKAAGVELHFVDSGQVSTDPMGGLVEYFKAAQASDERKKIRERMTRGVKAKAAVKWVGISYPYGYRRIGLRQEARLEIDPVQAEVVRKIFALYTGPGLVSMHKIAQILNEEGIPTPSGGGIWRRPTIRAMLNNRTYIGEVSFCGIVTQHPHLVIVSPETFEIVKGRIERNKEQSSRNIKNGYLLAGMIRCNCGWGVVRFWGQRKYQGKQGVIEYRYPFYRCSNGVPARERGCKNYTIRAEVLEDVVWGAVMHGLTHEVLREALRAKGEERAAELAPKRERLAGLDELIDKAQRRAKNYLRQSGELEDAMLAAEAEGLAKESSAQVARLRRERDRLALELNQEVTEAEQAATLAQADALLEKVSRGQPTLEQRRDFLRALDVRVKVCEGHKAVQVSYILGQVQAPIEYKQHIMPVLNPLAFSVIVPLDRSLAATWLAGAGVPVGSE